MPLACRRSLAGIAALGAAALIAGCGGGGSDSLSADEFRERADAICADSDERLATLTEPTTGDEVLPFLRAGLPIADEEAERISRLEPPEELRDALDEAQALNQERQDVIEQAADRIEGGEDAEAVIDEVTPEIERLREEARAKARELGLTVCGIEDDAGSTTAPEASAPGTAPATTAPPAAGADDVYVADVREAAGALQGFGTLLQGTTSLDDLRSKVPEARSQLDSFDAAIAQLDGYTLDNARLERQRSGLAETGPRVGSVLRRFLDAAGTGDTEAVQALVPQVTEAITDFQQAVTENP
jgi:hypothetical protein